ncbi:MAG: TonB-dependent receptor family protein [Planctomycetota bacterium]
MDGLAVSALVMAMQLAAPALSLAQDEDKQEKKPEPEKEARAAEPLELSEVTVYGEKIPGSIYRYDVADDSRTRTEDVGHVLQRIPGFNLLDEQSTGLWSNVGIRGVSPLRGRGALTLLDGAPAMLSLFGDNDWHVLPSVEQLERIEVVKGGASVLYGPNAIGGVVNFVTKEIPDEPFRKVRTTLGSDSLFIGELSAGGMYEDAGVSVSHTHKETDGWREHSALSTEDLLFKLGTRVGPRDDLQFTLNYFQSVSETPGALSPAEFRQDPSRSFTLNDKFRGQRFATSTRYTLHLDGDQSIQTGFYAQRMERFWRIARRSTTSADIWDLTGTFAGLEPRYSLEWEGPFGRPSELLAGMRLHAERSERIKMLGGSPKSTSGAATIIDLWDAVEVAPYAQNDFELLDDLHLTAGFRWEWYKLTIDNRIKGVKGDSTVKEPIWGLGARYGIGEGTIFAGVNRYLDPPQPQEEIDTSTGQRRNLENAVGMNYEIGLRSDHIPWLPLDFTLFWLDYKDQVVRQGLVYSNAGRSLHRGAELAFSLDAGHFVDWLDGLELYGNGTLLETRIKAGQFDGNELPYAPDTFNGGVRYTHRESGLGAYFEGIYTGRQFSDAANTRNETPDGSFGLIGSHTVYNTGLSYENEESGVSVFAGVKNLFDERYVALRWIFWGGKFPGAARSWFLGVGLRF